MRNIVEEKSRTGNNYIDIANDIIFEKIKFNLYSRTYVLDCEVTDTPMAP